MVRVLFAPVSIAGGLVAGVAATKIFEFVWGRFDDQEPPSPEHRDVSLPRMAAALLVQGAIFSLVRGAVDHAMRAWFYRGTHRWPGEERPESD